MATATPPSQRSTFTPEVLASVVLLAATCLALILANSSASDAYNGVLGASLTLGAGEITHTEALKGWIKNGLMAVFFIYVGLEIKAEFVEGALSDRARATLPFAAAAGGMIAPALIYLAAVRGRPEFAVGWAIPTATDIAFAVGVLGLLGPRLVPVALKALLLAIAVIDDLGAILIIAVVYTNDFHAVPLALSAIATAALVALNRAGIVRLSPYMAVGALLWATMLKSGVNPTLAGVFLALAIPMTLDENGSDSLHRLLAYLKWPVLFVIMPVFALASAGVTLFGLDASAVLHPVTVGIVVGLAVGKPAGILAATWLAIASGFAKLPAGLTTLQLVGMAWIAGIGFTMSLFVGALAFPDGPLMDAVRLGVLVGSLISTVAGILVLASQHRFLPPHQSDP